MGNRPHSITSLVFILHRLQQTQRLSHSQLHITSFQRRRQPFLRDADLTKHIVTINVVYIACKKHPVQFAIQQIVQEVYQLTDLLLLGNFPTV
jgi:hypothetical protein